MAQAARHNLRMQKELKLLLTDPPPAASFPHLSPDSDLSSFSLSSIVAHIEGPEDTVYAEGIFEINIQIPDRYPFQPPIVTFATPIYHPNIDNGGRICLDILNLPPKGAWQPSLNISTVLTSIGLLLSEPNPDDGLMCEASNEYKYNRQAFDQKARAMTKKYASAGASVSKRGSDTIKNQLQMETDRTEMSKLEVDKSSEGHRKLFPLSKKLSLDSSGSNQKRYNDRVNQDPIDNPLVNQMEMKEPNQQQKEMLEDYQPNKKLLGTRRKLSLESVGQSQKRSADYKENVLSNQCSSVSYHQNVSKGSSESMAVLLGSNCCEQQFHQQLLNDGDVKPINDSTDTRSKKMCSNDNKILNSMDSGQKSSSSLDLPQLSPTESRFDLSIGPLPMPITNNPCEQQHEKDSDDRIGSSVTRIKHKRLGLAGKKSFSRLHMSSKSREENNKENMASVPGILPSNLQSSESYDGKRGYSDMNVACKKLLGIRRKVPLESLCRSNGSNEINIHHLRIDNLDAKALKSVAEENRDDQKQLIEQEGEGLPIPESVVVLDSEDSDEDRNGTQRSKLSLTRRRLIGKRTAKV